MMRQNLLDRAMNIMDQCARLTPEDGQILFMRGLIYLDRNDRTMADGVRTAPSELTFAHMRARLDGIVSVSEADIALAVGRLAREAKLVVETSGALSVAAYLSHRDELPEGRTVAVLTGGNIDPKQLAELILA